MLKEWISKILVISMVWAPYYPVSSTYSAPVPRDPANQGEEASAETPLTFAEAMKMLNEVLTDIEIIKCANIFPTTACATLAGGNSKRHLDNRLRETMDKMEKSVEFHENFLSLPTFKYSDDLDDQNNDSNIENKLLVLGHYLSACAAVIEMRTRLGEPYREEWAMNCGLKLGNQTMEDISGQSSTANFISSSSTSPTLVRQVVAGKDFEGRNISKFLVHLNPRYVQGLQHAINISQKGAGEPNFALTSVFLVTLSEFLFDQLYSVRSYLGKLDAETPELSLDPKFADLSDLADVHANWERREREFRESALRQSIVNAFRKNYFSPDSMLFSETLGETIIVGDWKEFRKNNVNPAWQDISLVSEAFHQGVLSNIESPKLKEMADINYLGYYQEFQIVEQFSNIVKTWPSHLIDVDQEKLSLTVLTMYFMAAMRTQLFALTSLREKEDETNKYSDAEHIKNTNFIESFQKRQSYMANTAVFSALVDVAKSVELPKVTNNRRDSYSGQLLTQAAELIRQDRSPGQKANLSVLRQLVMRTSMEQFSNPRVTKWVNEILENPTFSLARLAFRRIMNREAKKAGLQGHTLFDLQGSYFNPTRIQFPRIKSVSGPQRLDSLDLTLEQDQIESDLRDLLHVGTRFGFVMRPDEELEEQILTNVRETMVSQIISNSDGGVPRAEADSLVSDIEQLGNDSEFNGYIHMLRMMWEPSLGLLLDNLYELDKTWVSSIFSWGRSSIEKAYFKALELSKKNEFPELLSEIENGEPLYETLMRIDGYDPEKDESDIEYFSSLLPNWMDRARHVMRTEMEGDSPDYRKALTGFGTIVSKEVRSRLGEFTSRKISQSILGMVEDLESFQRQGAVTGTQIELVIDERGSEIRDIVYSDIFDRANHAVRLMLEQKEAHIIGKISQLGGIKNLNQLMDELTATKLLNVTMDNGDFKQTLYENREFLDSAIGPSAFKENSHFVQSRVGQGFMGMFAYWGIEKLLFGLARVTPQGRTLKGVTFLLERSSLLKSAWRPLTQGFMTAILPFIVYEWGEKGIEAFGEKRENSDTAKDYFMASMSNVDFVTYEGYNRQNKEYKSARKWFFITPVLLAVFVGFGVMAHKGRGLLTRLRTNKGNKLVKDLEELGFSKQNGFGKDGFSLADDALDAVALKEYEHFMKSYSYEYAKKITEIKLRVVKEVQKIYAHWERRGQQLCIHFKTIGLPCGTWNPDEIAQASRRARMYAQSAQEIREIKMAEEVFRSEMAKLIPLIQESRFHREAIKRAWYGVRTVKPNGYISTELSGDSHFFLKHFYEKIVVNTKVNGQSKTVEIFTQPLTGRGSATKGEFWW